MPAAGFERCVGTILGGWLAFGLESGSHNGVYLGFTALVVGWVGYCVGYSADLKYGIGKLFPQAFIVGGCPLVHAGSFWACDADIASS